jgi:hypothetical protein
MYSRTYSVLVRSMHVQPQGFPRPIQRDYISDLLLHKTRQYETYRDVRKLLNGSVSIKTPNGNRLLRQRWLANAVNIYHNRWATDRSLGAKLGTLNVVGCVRDEERKRFYSGKCPTYVCLRLRTWQVRCTNVSMGRETLSCEAAALTTRKSGLWKVQTPDGDALRQFHAQELPSLDPPTNYLVPTNLGGRQMRGYLYSSHRSRSRKVYQNVRTLSVSAWAGS